MKRIEKIKEYRRMPKKELEHLLKEKRQDLMELKFDLTGGKVKNVRGIREMRRDIARISTLIKNSTNKD